MITATFHGHACLSLAFANPVGQRTRLVIDPYESGGYGGLVAMPPLPASAFEFAAFTHGHGDHSAVFTVPYAAVIAAPYADHGIRLEAKTAAHDQFEGKLRGGFTRMLRVSVGGRTVVHLGDLGQRVYDAGLAWLQETPIELLVIPVGGYFTLDADGAAEWVAELKPSTVLPCHSSDDGTRFPQLASKKHFLRRFTQENQSMNGLSVAVWDGSGSLELE